MTMGVINGAAQFERDLLIERTQSGLARAKAEGTALGLPAVLEDVQRDAVRAGLQPAQACLRSRGGSVRAGRL
jgi:putative DNA-invertase from lambdoid prophage Rac